MAAKITSSGQYAQSLLQLIFNGTTYANLAINATTSPFTNLYVSLHTASPGASGNQSTSEAAYTSYSRVAVTRTSAGWTVTANSVSPTASVTFPTASGGSETETYFGVGVSASGAGNLLYFGTLSPNLAVSNGVQPILSTSTAISET